MILITVIDDHGGLRFNHRRQSRDRVLTERILSRAAGQRLLVTPCSAVLFGAAEALTVCEAPLDLAGQGDCCFIEAGSAAAYTDRIEKLILYRWNRVYPADLHFDLDFGGWQLLSREDFAGHSHETITEEIYIP